ncbi:MAG: hypothetical protein IJI87_12035 [Mogibacterium sp.]|nr:hypothetical protein [Mogibacterium sp.]
MKNRIIKHISKTYIVLLVTITLMGLAACGSEDIAADNIRLSETIKGEWYGQVDIAKMIYQTISDEIGIELSPNPAYCDVMLASG